MTRNNFLMIFTCLMLSLSLSKVNLYSALKEQAKTYIQKLDLDELSDLKSNWTEQYKQLKKPSKPFAGSTESELKEFVDKTIVAKTPSSSGKSSIKGDQDSDEFVSVVGEDEDESVSSLSSEREKKLEQEVANLKKQLEQSNNAAEIAQLKKKIKELETMLAQMPHKDEVGGDVAAPSAADMDKAKKLGAGLIAAQDEITRLTKAINDAGALLEAQLNKIVKQEQQYDIRFAAYVWHGFVGMRALIPYVNARKIELSNLIKQHEADLVVDNFEYLCTQLDVAIAKITRAWKLPQPKGIWRFTGAAVIPWDIAVPFYSKIPAKATTIPTSFMSSVNALINEANIGVKKATGGDIDELLKVEKPEDLPGYAVAKTEMENKFNEIKESVKETNLAAYGFVFAKDTTDAQTELPTGKDTQAEQATSSKPKKGFLADIESGVKLKPAKKKTDDSK